MTASFRTPGAKLASVVPQLQLIISAPFCTAFLNISSVARILKDVPLMGINRDIGAAPTIPLPLAAANATLAQGVPCVKLGSPCIIEEDWFQRS